MITDIFSHRYNEDTSLAAPQSFFVQMHNLLNDYNLGVRGAFERINGYEYSESAHEHGRLVSQAIDKFCNEVGWTSLRTCNHLTPKREFPFYTDLENYMCHSSTPFIEKLSLVEILLRDMEEHLANEIRFIEEKTPEYQSRSDEIEKKSLDENTNYYNDGKEKLLNVSPLLEQKKKSLELLRSNTNKRLKLHKIPLDYHNGYFQKSTDDMIEDKIAQPFWALISDTQYKNVEKDMLESLHQYDTNGPDPALYAGKALESMLKVVCANKDLTKETEKPAAYYLGKLNCKKNGSIIINQENEELLKTFKIRNSYGAHGAGTEDMPELTPQQVRRYIDSCMAWICSLSKR